MIRNENKMDEFTLKGKRVVGILKIVFGVSVFISFAFFLPPFKKELDNYTFLEESEYSNAIVHCFC